MPLTTASGSVTASGNNLVVDNGISVDSLMLMFADNYGFSGVSVTTSANQATGVSPSNSNGETEIEVVMTNISFQAFTGTATLENGCGEVATFSIEVTGLSSQ